jgi:serine protease AprX
MQWTDATGPDADEIRGAGSAARGGSSVTLSWTLGAAKTWAMVAAVLKPVSGPATALTGSGVTVAVIDSGLLQDGGGTTRIKTTRDFTSGSLNPAHVAPLDPYGHGSHVAGLIGDHQNEDDIRGVAPGVQYVSLRVLDGLGIGLTSNVIHAIEWAVANKATYGIDVINLSLGHPIYEAAATDPLVQAIEAAVRAGIVVVTAAGNVGMNPLTGQVGYAGILSPGNAPSAITVGAVKSADTTTRADDLVADYSSRGPTWYDAFTKPDIVAPAHRLLGPATTTQLLYTVLPTLRDTRGGRPYLRLSGTSMAAGVVSGSVALMIEAAKTNFGVKPTANALKAMLQHSALILANAQGARYDALTQGAGGLNAAGAVALASAINPTIPVGSQWLVTGVTESTVVDGQQLAWANQIVWDTHIVRGTSVYTHSQSWNDNVVWGTGTDDHIVWGTNLDDHIVWGTNLDNIVWGTTADDHIVWGTNWGEHIVWGTNWDDNIVWGTSADDNIVWGTLGAN